MEEKRNLFRAFWILFKGYWKSEEKWKAIGLFAVVIGLNFASVWFLVQINTWYNEFYNALQEYQADSFWYLVGKFTGLAFCYIIIAVYAIYLRQLLQIRWRTWMTKNYLNSWMQNQTYYHLQNSTDNPDQRISEDIGSLVNITLQLIVGFLKQITTLVAFSFVLWELSGEFTFEIGGNEFVIYGYMFWFSVIYSGLGTWLVHKVGKKLIGLEFDQQRYEADFRFSMMRVRENSESIAFYRGEPAELESFFERFKNVIQNFRNLMTKTKHLNFYVNGYGQLAIIVPLILAAPKYFSKEIQLGGLMQTVSAFGRVQDALSYFVDSYATIAGLAAVINRLAGFTEHVEEVQKVENKIEKSSADKLKISDLNISLPTGRQLLNNLALELENKKSLLVVGASGCGKSTLLRTLAGIWDYASGKISLPENSKVMFLPQKPYLPLGTLRRALIYPVAEKNSPSDDKLKSVLKIVELESLTEKLDDVDDWSRILSVGEQQRLAFARVLLSEPNYIFLDEATSALDEPRELEMYDLLKKNLPDATVVSVGHRSTLYQVHDTELKLDGTGNWQVREI